MQVCDYSRLALTTESPIGALTVMRYGQIAKDILACVQLVMYQATDADGFKRHVFYGEPGDSNDPGIAACAPELRTTHGVLGLISELHELLEAYTTQETLDKVNLLEELGDLIWYINLIAVANGIELEQVFEKNLVKLAARNKSLPSVEVGQGFNLEGTLNRDLENERKVLEGQ